MNIRDVNKGLAFLDREIEAVAKIKGSPLTRSTRLDEFQNLRDILAIVQRKLTPDQEVF